MSTREWLTILKGAKNYVSRTRKKWRRYFTVSRLKFRFRCSSNRYSLLDSAFQVFNVLYSQHQVQNLFAKLTYANDNLLVAGIVFNFHRIKLIFASILRICLKFGSYQVATFFPSTNLSFRCKKFIGIFLKMWFFVKEKREYRALFKKQVYK